MRKIGLTLAVVFTVTASLISCRETETKTETIVKEVEVPVKETTEEGGGILERAGERVDREANKEIDKAIDNIGDDN